MPSRFVQVTLINNSKFTVRWVDDSRAHGWWQEPWYPSNFTDLRPGQVAQWRMESGGVMKGLEGHADFKIDVPLRGGADESELISFWWERPYIGFFAKNIRHDVPLQKSRDGYLPHVRVIDHQSRGWSEASFGDVLAHVVLPYPISPVATMANQANNTHCFWTVEIVNNEGRISLPLESPPPVIYGVQEGGGLLWYQHEGYSDGAATWATNSGAKIGHGWDFKHVFSGGGGIVYAIENKSLDPRTGQRSGGDLFWYRHDGWQDGSGDWAGPSIAGTGWDGFSQVFHGGGEIIYATQETSRNPATGQRTGGQLLWYRHQGRNNGTNNWAQGSGRVVGLLWNIAQVFSG